MSFERLGALSGHSDSSHGQIGRSGSWSDHEIWQRAGQPPAVEAVLPPGGSAAVEATALIAVKEPTRPRLRRRREIGRSLFSTFDVARRRCAGHAVIRMSGY